ncbi:response regulator [Bacillaceae bacterium S4-13-58]
MVPHVLIVDDQPGICLLLEEILKQEEIKVSIATDGRKALDMTNKNQYDVILLDYHLPLYNGKQVIKELEKKDYKTSIIVMSGTSRENVEVLSQNPLVKKIISKPFDIQELRNFVLSILPKSS